MKLEDLKVGQSYRFIETPVWIDTVVDVTPEENAVTVTMRRLDGKFKRVNDTFKLDLELFLKQHEAFYTVEGFEV